MGQRAHVSLLAVVVVWAGSFSVIEALLDDGVPALERPTVWFVFGAEHVVGGIAAAQGVSLPRVSGTVGR